MKRKKVDLVAYSGENHGRPIDLLRSRVFVDMGKTVHAL